MSLLGAAADRLQQIVVAGGHLHLHMQWRRGAVLALALAMALALASVFVDGHVAVHGGGGAGLK